MSLLHRQDSVFTQASDLDVQALALATVTVFDVGGVASASSPGTTITLYAGHGFAAGDKLMVGLDQTTYRTIVGSPGATSLEVNSNVTVTAKDVIVNLGTDTGALTPNYDGSTVLIYDVPSTGATPLSQSRVTASSTGGYSYYFPSDVSIWELIRSTLGVPVAIVIQNTQTLLSTTGTPVVDNEIVRFNGTDGLSIQGTPNANRPTISDAGVITAPAANQLGQVGNTTAILGALSVAQTLAVTGVTTVSGIIQPNATNTIDLGLTGTRFKDLYLAGAANVAGALNGATLAISGASTLSGVVTTNQLATSIGSVPTVTNPSALANGWGSTGAATVAANSTGNRFTITVTPNGSGLTNPATMQVNFATAFTSIPPFAVVAMNKVTGMTGAVGTVGWSTTTAAITIQYNALPAAGSTYIFSVILLG